MPLTNPDLVLRGVVFDMDGVLVDSEPLHYHALSSVLAAEGHAWTEEDNERLLGTTVEDSFRIISQTVPLSKPVDSYVSNYDDMVLSLLKGPLDPAPGVMSLLQGIRVRGAPTAVASSSYRSWIAATLRSLGLTRYFSVTVSGEDVSHGKPAPDIYLAAARKLNLHPSECVAIEDAPNGALSAKRAGLRVVVVRTPYTAHLEMPPADLTVDSLEELPADDLLSL